MNKTKEKILHKALQLFNKHGVNDTTLRKIALNLEMSQGNLNYHFKTKQELIEKLYFELVEKLNVEIEKMSKEGSVLHTMYTSSNISIACLYESRFLMRDFAKILRENKVLQEHYAQLQQMRLVQFYQIFELLIQQKTVRPEELPQEYKRVYERMRILGDNWINEYEIVNKEIANPVAYYQALLFELIYPYLTQQGKKEFAAIVPSTGA